MHALIGLSCTRERIPRSESRSLMLFQSSTLIPAFKELL